MKKFWHEECAKFYYSKKEGCPHCAAEAVLVADMQKRQAEIIAKFLKSSRAKGTKIKSVRLVEEKEESADIAVAAIAVAENADELKDETK